MRGGRILFYALEKRIYNGRINWNFNGKWTNQNFIVKFIIPVAITRCPIMMNGNLIDMKSDDQNRIVAMVRSFSIRNIR